MGVPIFPQALQDIEALVVRAGAEYDVNLGGKKGNVQLTTYDGEYRVERNIADRLGFTEELEAAKELIDRCIMKWSEGGNSNIRVLVDRAFRTDGKGKIKTAAVMDLFRVDINDDEDWLVAMEALKDSIHVAATATYVRIYRRVADSDQYEAIPLDLAAVRPLTEAPPKPRPPQNPPGNPPQPETTQ